LPVGYIAAATLHPETAFAVGSGFMFAVALSVAVVRPPRSFAVALIAAEKISFK
jgi:hypothetical protein